MENSENTWDYGRHVQAVCLHLSLATLSTCTSSYCTRTHPHLPAPSCNCSHKRIENMTGTRTPTKNLDTSFAFICSKLAVKRVACNLTRHVRNYRFSVFCSPVIQVNHQPLSTAMNHHERSLVPSFVEVDELVLQGPDEGHEDSQQRGSHRRRQKHEENVPGSCLPSGSP